MWIEFHSYHEVSHLDNLPAAVHDDASEDDKATKSKSPHQKDDGAACTLHGNSGVQCLVFIHNLINLRGFVALKDFSSWWA